MNAETKAIIVREHTEARIALSERKCLDYADPTDVLKNFRERHEIFRILDIRPSERLCDVYLADVVLKLQRICNLLHSNHPAENEAVGDSIADAQNYLDLLSCQLTEDTASHPEYPQVIGEEKYLSRETLDKLASLRLAPNSRNADGTP